MSLTPQSIPSSPSVYPYKSNHPPTYEYPSPARSDGNSIQPAILYGLGLFSECPMPMTDAERHMSMSPLSSAHAVSSWSSSALQPHATTSQSLPSGSGGLFPLGYDPFPHYNGGNHGHDHYSSHSTVNSALPASPVPSLEDSQRSSFSSISSTPYYSGGGNMQHGGFNSRVKMEGDWSHDQIDTSLMPPMSGPSGLPHMDPAMNDSRAFDPNYYQQPHLNWQRFDQNDNMTSSMTPPPQMGRIEGRDSPLSRDRRASSANVTRVRQPRKLTTKEDANFQCRVKGCGKLFGRSYNYKAHMETHDAARVYPFPCPVQDCTKKFVRKTDLQRHHQSVHMKQRNFRCDYCQRHFARKDTLRRSVWYIFGNLILFTNQRTDIWKMAAQNDSILALLISTTEVHTQPTAQRALLNYQILSPNTPRPHYTNTLL